MRSYSKRVLRVRAVDWLVVVNARVTWLISALSNFPPACNQSYSVVQLRYVLKLFIQYIQERRGHCTSEVDKKNLLRFQTSQLHQRFSCTIITPGRANTGMNATWPG